LGRNFRAGVQVTGGMLSAYFDIPAAAPTTAAPFGRAAAAKRARKNSAAAAAGRGGDPAPTDPTRTAHAGFEPLPPERNVPRAAEQAGQPWQPLPGAGVTRDDDVAEFRADWDGDDGDGGGEEWDGGAREGGEADDDVSEPDYEPESLDPLGAATAAGAPGVVTDSLDSAPGSFEDRTLQAFFNARRCRQKLPPQHVVYSGPMLCCEDEDDLD
jgi:hypothetical protein